MSEIHRDYNITVIPMAESSFHIKVMPLLPEMEGWHDDFEIEDATPEEAQQAAHESVDVNYRLYNENLPS